MLGNLIEKSRIWLWSRSQHDSEPLRRYFHKNFRVDVGKYSYGCFDQWRMPGPMKIGRYCSIARTVRYVPINHPYDAITTHPVLYERKFGAVDHDLHWEDCLHIEDDVWIGHYVVILPSCKFIGRGAIIGAGAIVTKNVEPYSIMAGNPARKIKARFEPDLIAKIEATKWWTKSSSDLRQLVAENPEVVFHPTAEQLAALENPTAE